MAKDKISDYSATANSNTDIAGINIDEGCAPSGINDAIRTLMKQLKDWQSGSQDIYIHPAGSAAAPSITATGDTNTGVFFPAADTVGITTGGTERARVDSAGNLGLGVTPSAWNSGSKAIQIGAQGAIEYRGNATSIATNAYYDSVGYKYITSSAAALYFQYLNSHTWSVAPSGTAGNAITFTQILAVEKDTSLALQGATTKSGTGITFPATQSASSDANTLDDYEEGSFTPSLTFGGGSTGLTYTYQVARYVKIGKNVLVNIHLYLGNIGSSTGSVSISGLPFTSENSNASDSYIPLGMRAKITLTAGSLPFAYLSSNNTSIELYQTGSSGGNAAQLTNSNFTTNSEFNINFWYVASA